MTARPATYAPAAERQATALLVLAALSFSMISILTVMATRVGMTLSMFLLVRYAVAVGALTIAMRWEPPGPGDRAQVARVMIVGGIGQTAIAVLSLAALAWIPAATLVVLFYTFPAWVTLLAAWRKTEPLSTRRVVALLLSLAGILSLVGWPGGAAIHVTGTLFALSAAVIYAVYIPVISRLQVGLTATRSTWLIACGVTAALVIATLVRREVSLEQPLLAWSAAVTTGVVSTALGLKLFMRGLAVLGPVRTSIVCTVEPIFAAVLAALVLAQPITVPMLVGGALIMSAVLLLSWRPEMRGR